HRARARRERPRREAVQPRGADAAGRAGARPMISDGILIGAVIVIAVLFVIGVLLLVLHGAITALFDRLRERRIGRARDALLSAPRRGVAARAAPETLHALSREGALGLREELAPSLAGPELDALSQIAHQRGLIEHAENECSSRRWRRRLHAVR